MPAKHRNLNFCTSRPSYSSDYYSISAKDPLCQEKLLLLKNNQKNSKKLICIAFSFRFFDPAHLKSGIRI